MKHWFVLDEGVVMAAATLENSSGQSDRRAGQLVQDILRNCHGIAVDNAVLRRWSRQIDQLREERRPLAPTIFSLLTQVDFNVEKYLHLPPSLPLEGEDAWSPKLQDDRDFIRLAARSHGVLATHDEPLIQDVLNLGLSNQHEFRVATVPQAMELAAEPSS